MSGLAAFLVLHAAVLAGQPAIPGPGEIDHESRPEPIYGGEIVAPGDWPAVVEIRTPSRCTGTLVAPDLVLTAAHCLEGLPNSVTITIGDTFVDGEQIDAEAWGAHPEFCYPSDCGEDIHDFAWVRLPAPVEIPPILPITDQAEYDEVMQVGTPLVFVGFGKDELSVTGIKREVDASITSFNASGREFRAGGGGKDTCQGDSGGPALAQNADGEWRIVGVLSRGGDCGQGGVYGVPFPELCWLRDDSGVDLVPEGCDECECLSLVRPDIEEGGCECAAGSSPSPEQRPWWLLAEFAAIAALGLCLRRRWSEPIS